MPHIEHIEAGVKSVAELGQDYLVLKRQCTISYLLSIAAGIVAGFSLCLVVFWPHWPQYLRPLCLLMLLPTAVLIPNHLLLIWRLSDKEKAVRALCQALEFVTAVRQNNLCRSYNFWGIGDKSQNEHFGLSWGLKAEEVKLFVQLFRSFGHPIHSY